MKILIELKDEDVEWLKKTFSLDVTKLLSSFIANIVEGLREFQLADKANVPISEEEIREFANKIGSKVFREAKEGEKTP